MSKLLVNAPSGQEIIEISATGGYFDAARVLWDERTDGPMPAVTLGGMKRVGDALEYDAALYTAYQDAVVKPSLKAAVAAKRYERETAGITWTGIVGQNIPIATDRDSEYLIHASYTAAKDFNMGRDWKGSDGNFYTMTAAQVMSMATSVLAYINECRALEKTKCAEIDSTGTTDINTGWPAQVRA